MQMNPSIFKEYDLRAIADKDLTDGVVRNIGLALGTYFMRGGEKEVILCQDVRFSSPRIAKGIAQAMAEAGCDVIDIGVYPTPVCYFAGKKLQISASIMITASHNPSEYNGMKITSRDANIYGEEIQKIRRMAEQEDFVYGVGSVRTYDTIEDDYIDYITSIVKLARPLRIGIDAGNGAAGHTAKRLFEALGCQVEALYCDPDPAFPNHHPDPTIPKNLEALTAQVLAKGLDCGLGFDGDGDRLGVVDDAGNIIWGDMLQILFWRDLMPRHPGSEVIVEVKCSQALVDEAKRLGGKPFFYKTGHSLIKAKMREKGLLYAGEMSGHMFFADEYFGYDDAMYAGARLLRLLADSDKKMSQMLGSVPAYVATPEMRIACAEELKAPLMQRIVKRFSDGPNQVITVDGARVIFPDGWGLLRQSNTQPILVMRAESTSKEGLARIVAELQRAVEEEKSALC
nr:phosphomannomutase/phosphoglucomutase [Maliibacterium massiliense]